LALHEHLLTVGVDFDGTDWAMAEDEVGEESAASANEEMKRSKWSVVQLIHDIRSPGAECEHRVPLSRGIVEAAPDR
jgi:hypothetical protein